ncbi:glutamate-rich protein 6B [Python bivittatus]|uniref:Glutamate-rich protein 6B n=1 Tax=Python bivittatus TaxID=176946 RepID=A0A9F5J0I7_PYTBI|nr:glutamate-rich protein 6B [Python bivittatus]
MSNGLNPSGIGGKKQLPSKKKPDSASQPASDKPSSSLLTIENVKKLQEKNTVAKSDLAHWSIETYIKGSNRLLNASRTNTEGSREQTVSYEEESGVPHEGCSENSDETSGKDFQRRPLSISIPEAQPSKKREVADLETQTEWSYSDSAADSSELRKPVFTFPILIVTGRNDKREEEEEEIYATELESQENFSDEEEVKTLLQDKDHSTTDLCLIRRCEFCTTPLKPLPMPEELEEKPEKMDHFLCCRTYKEVFQCVIQELIESPEGEIDINPHPRISQSVMDSKTKKMLIEELQERGFEKYKEIFEQYIKFGACTKIHFRLSDYPPKPEMTVLKKQYPDPKELLEIDLEFKAEQLKFCHPFKPVQRYFQNGKIFFLLFPDGTGQVYYPSGRVAILITYIREIQFTYIVLNDSKTHELQALFTNQGYAAYYQQNQKLRLNLDLCTGSFFDKHGNQEKYWNWWDNRSHVHAPPFQPICIQLNAYIQVKIKAQDQIFLTFTKCHDCLQLNIGARLKLKDPDMLWVLQQYGTSDQLVSHSMLDKISNLLTSIKELLKKLCSSAPEESGDLRLLSQLYAIMHRRCKKTSYKQCKKRN